MEFVALMTGSARAKRRPAKPRFGLLRHAEKRGAPGGERDEVNVEIASSYLLAQS